MSPVPIIQDETAMSSDSQQENSSQDSDREFIPRDAISSTDSVLDSFESVSVSESNSASAVPKCHNISTTSTPFGARSGDKSTIIRLHNELLKSKQSNWQVVDALSKAYQDLRELRIKEQQFNTAHYNGGSLAQQTKDNHVNDKVLNFQLELMKEDVLKAKANVLSLTDQRDVLKQSLSRAQSELRLLSFDNSRKVSELEFARDHVRSVETDVRLKIDRIIQSEQKTSLLEREILLRDRKLEDVSSEFKILEEEVLKRDREIQELKTKLHSEAEEKKESEQQLSQMESKLEYIQSVQTDLCEVKENERRLAEERRDMEESLQQFKVKRAQDSKVILDLKAQVQEWERYGARMAKSMNEFVHDTNLRQIHARQEIADYVTVLEQKAQKQETVTPQNWSRDPRLYDSDISTDEVFLPAAPSRNNRIKLEEPYSGSKGNITRPRESSSLDGKLSEAFNQAFSSNRDGVGTIDRKSRNEEELDNDTESMTSLESQTSRDATSVRKSSSRGSHGSFHLLPSEYDGVRDTVVGNRQRNVTTSSIYREKSGFSLPRRSRQVSGLGLSLQSWRNSPAETSVQNFGRPQSSTECHVTLTRRSSEEESNSVTDYAASSRTTTPLPQSDFSYESSSYPEEMHPTPSKHNLSKAAATKASRENHRLTPSVNKLTRQQRRAALLLVFRHLTPLELCDMARVCKEWKDLSEEPRLWSTVELEGLSISNMALLAISRRCGFLQQLKLKNLKKINNKKRSGKEENNCYLERGLECILKATGHSLLSLHIEDCGFLVSDRCLILTGSHCRAVQEVVYISDAFPPCPEALWALWACRQLVCLRVPPMFPCDHPNRFNDKSLETIANCWPNLRRLSVGGPGITTTGLIHIVKGCLRLQELELDRTFAINEETVYALCLCGLRGLEVMSFSFTTVSPAAIKQLFSACPCLEYIAVHIGISDYFSDVDDPGNISKYNHIVASLKGLTDENIELRRVLRIKADYG